MKAQLLLQRRSARVTAHVHHHHSHASTTRVCIGNGLPFPMGSISQTSRHLTLRGEFYSSTACPCFTSRPSDTSEADQEQEVVIVRPNGNDQASHNPTKPLPTPMQSGQPIPVILSTQPSFTQLQPALNTASAQSQIPKNATTQKSITLQPNTPKTSEAATPKRHSKLWRLFKALIIHLGKALRALAFTFCLLVLLLMKPRAAGASAIHAAPVWASTHTIDGASYSMPHHFTSSSSKAQTSESEGWFSRAISHMMQAPSQQPGYNRTWNPILTLADNDVVAAAQTPEGTSDSDAVAVVGSPAVPVMPSGAALLAAQEAATVALLKAVQPSVVNISGSRAAGTFSSLDVSRTVAGQGSGFVWDDRGHVVTNYSCVRGAAEVKVTLADGNTFTAKLLGADASKDVAVLRLSMPKARLKELQPVKQGLSNGPGGLAIGSMVWAIGNATGLDHTVTQGIVSGLGRELPGAGAYPIKGLIQTSAASGHQAGGVLINTQGRMVGMVVAPYQTGGRAAGYGLGYALPIEAMRGLVDQILATGRPGRPTLGVTLAPPQLMAAQGVEGVLVLEVPPGSPAANAGLRHTHRDIFGDLILGDVIVGLEGGPIRHIGDLYAALDTRKPGDRVRLDVLRDGKATSMTVVLGERGQAGALEE